MSKNRRARRRPRNGSNRQLKPATTISARRLGLLTLTTIQQEESDLQGARQTLEQAVASG